jgi:hypothetical protein
MPVPKSTKRSQQKPTRTGALDPKRCEGRKTKSGFGSSKKRQQLQLQTCCVYLMDVLQNGFAKAQKDPKRLLKPFMSQLADEFKRDALFDYCYVQFDLTEAQVSTLKDFSKRMLVPIDEGDLPRDEPGGEPTDKT